MSIAFRDLPVYDLTGATRNFEQLVSFQFKGKALEGGLEEPTLVTGAWTNPTGVSAKLEGFASVQVRTEQGSTVARLKGTAKSKEAIPALTNLFTLPAGFRPKETIREWGEDITGAVVMLVVINTTGIVENTGEVAINHFIGFDGITFNLT